MVILQPFRDDMSAKKCAREECGKSVYPIEELKCLDKMYLFIKVWHKQCFKCTVCGMTLNMKNYKGYDKKPYCEPHYPKTVASVVADTPEMRRIAENTKNQSQVKYHAEYEKMKGTKIEIADDPEVTRHLKNTQAQSQLAYSGELDKRKKMEEVRPANVQIDSSGINKVLCPPLPESGTTVHSVETPFTSHESTSVYSSDSGGAGKIFMQQQRTVGSIADYDPLNGNWGTVAQSRSMDKIKEDTRYCVDFAEEVANRQPVLNGGTTSANGSNNIRSSVLSSSGAAGFAVKAIYDYTAADKDEISFLEGDVIVNCEKVDEGWMTGTVQRTLQWGMLPANYVQHYKLPTGLHRIN
uniref:LIM and SH3 domain protein F42H10.3 n=1 Tax=Heterorhabditis bacteriophora TaxID=37862 RepID=A0A1I7XSU3_HETBA